MSFFQQVMLMYGSASTQVIGMGTNSSPWVAAYYITSAAWGTKFANPSTAQTNRNRSFFFSPDGAYAAMGGESTPYFSVYQWSNSSGFGTRSTNPATLPTGATFSIRFTPSGASLLIAGNTSPFMTAYPFSAGTIGTKYADPSSLPVAVTRMSVTEGATSGTTDAAVKIASSPFAYVYPFTDGTGWGTRYSNPGTLPNTGAGDGLSFSRSGAALGLTAAANSTTIYSWTPGTGWGTRYTMPGTIIRTYAINFSNTEVFMSGDATPFAVAYPWDDSTGIGTVYSNPASLPATDSYFHINPNAAGNLVAVGGGSVSPYMYVYNFTPGSGWGTRLSNPGTLPTTSRASDPQFLTQ